MSMRNHAALLLLAGILVSLPFLSITPAAAQPGALVCWGNNGSGQLNVPAPNSGFLDAAGGFVFSIGLRTDGSIVGWGDNTYGQINTPAPNADFVSLSAGDTHSLGLKSTGAIVGWGRNSSGQLNVPAPNSGFAAVAAGGGHSLGVKTAGNIVCWGNNVTGQLDVPAPNAGFIAASGGAYHSLGLKADSSVVAWGWNTSGQLNVPAPNSGFVAIAAGGSHNLGLKSDGSIVGWGDNSAGQLNVPAPNSGFLAIAAGSTHSMGLRSDGSIVCWGDGYFGQLNVPAPNSGFAGVAGGSTHSFGLKGDPPVSVELLSFKASRVPAGAEITWVVGKEDVDYLGFHVYRGPQAERRRISEALLTGQQSSAFLDPDPPTTRALYWLSELTRSGDERWYGPAILEHLSAIQPVLSHAPNPFREMMQFSFRTLTEGPVRLEVYDVLGRRVAALLDESLGAGQHDVEWNRRDSGGRRVPGGIYFARLETGAYAREVRLVALP